MTSPIQLDDGIRLISGQMFDYNNPGANEVDIEDIAIALSHICRFAGHLPYHYSVAQHLYNTSMIVPSAHAFTALLHDTSEAFTNDIPTPLKVAVPAFKDLEIRIESEMGKRFGFEFPYPPEVKYADLQMLMAEKIHIKKDFSHWACLDGVEMPPLENIILYEIRPDQAYDLFMKRYDILIEREKIKRAA